MLLGGIDGALRMRGTRPPPLGEVQEADGSGLGDASVGGRVRFVGSSKSHFGLGFQGLVIVPIPGSERAYRGESQVAGRPELIADVRAPYFHAALNVGALLRNEISIGSTKLGSDVLYALSLGLPLHERFELMVARFAPLARMLYSEAT